jgi:energy-coupling factor transporter ATP-binding protein EcfA2
MAQLDPEEARRRLVALGEVFTPSAPINDQELFAGRNHELFSVIEAMQSAGQHAVIYGERGVGKTSLVRVSTQLASERSGILTARINCDGNDTYETLWHKVLDEIQIKAAEAAPPDQEWLETALKECGDLFMTTDLSPSTIRLGLRKFSQRVPLALFFDEFNEVADSTAIALLANTIKALSDHIEPITLCPVGVAEDLDALLEGHLSAVRALVQIKMPRMTRDELADIGTRGLRRLDMTIAEDAVRLIRVIPRGLPQYAHLLAQEGARQALLNGRDDITRRDVVAGLEIGLSKLDRSLSRAYEKATYSPRRTRLKEVLLACAVAKLGDMGDFSPSDLRDPYSRIIREQVDIDRFNPQLTSLATARDILVREGEERRWRYRFRDPLMEPYVLLDGLRTGSISPDDFPH